MENNCNYKCIQKGYVTIFIANLNDEQEKKTESGLITNFNSKQLESLTGDKQGLSSIETKISRQTEGYIVDMTEGCFDSDIFVAQPKIGDKVAFKGYAGDIYENDRGDFYRIMEDKYIKCLTN